MARLSGALYDYYVYEKLISYAGMIHISTNYFRYDTENTGAINGEKFLNRLGITLRPESNGAHRFTPTADSGIFETNHNFAL